MERNRVVQQREDFFYTYFKYAHGTETPDFFHRWAAIAGLGAFLGRNLYLAHGRFTIYPNIYCMLIGNAGTKKTTAIKMMKEILIKADYTTIAADRTTKEKFLLDMCEPESSSASLDTMQIFGDASSNVTSEILVAADEFNDFIGLGNHDFISLLGNLWDYTGEYKSRIKTGKSISVYNPTVSILGGNTSTGFALAFPTEILGQGFFSRLLLVYSEPTGVKITWPARPTEDVTQAVLDSLKVIKAKCFGEAVFTPEAETLLDRIYQSWKPLEDSRFESYSNRRFPHLLKLVLITCAARASTTIEVEDVVYANTVLTHTESLMPKALGEFGKSKNSDVVHKVMQLFDSTHSVLAVATIWKHVVQDLDKINDLIEILRNLVLADKIKPAGGGFLPNRKALLEVSDGTVNYTLLHELKDLL